MVKISISLPNNTQITLESEESEVLHEVVSIVLRDLPRDLMQSPAGSNGQEQNGSTQKGSSAADTAIVIAAATADETSATGNPVRSVSPTTRARRTPPASGGNRHPPTQPEPQTDAPPSLHFADHPAQAGTDFTDFCHAANPMGDMRRVVVATDGAARYFDADGVTSGDLEALFDLAGWRRPGNFTQTLRNAARTKFGWLERIPGRAGRYAATDLGRSKTQIS